MNNKQWPATIDEAVGVVIAALPEAEAAKIAAMPESDLINLHFGLGMWIRNNLGLWQGNEALMQVLREREPGIHPDDASMLIIEQVWRRLTIVKMLVTGLVMALLAGAFLKLKLFGGGQ